ncbi:hypothetical protein ACJRO7_004050 [Eucalyptus globulus]|uniref:TIR domain-containing protein n=1 Tax=Eucalyptus globulus TaxID=34317 RepID=A0ABD3IZV1_EUCGL
MFKCKQKMGHMVIPIFYGVEPSHVRLLKGRFGRAIHSREKRLPGMVAPREGHQALTGDANMRGWDHDDASPDGELIKAVVRGTPGVLLRVFQLDIPEHLLRFGHCSTSGCLDVEDSMRTHEWWKDSERRFLRKRRYE